MSKRAILIALCLLLAYAIAHLMTVIGDAQYDDRNPLLQLSWWLANTWVVPVMVVVILATSAFRRWLNGPDSLEGE